MAARTSPSSSSRAMSVSGRYVSRSSGGSLRTISLSVMGDSFSTRSRSEPSPRSGHVRDLHAEGLGERSVPLLASRQPRLQAFEVHEPAPALVVVIHVEQRLRRALPPFLIEARERGEVAVVVDGGGPH